MLFDVVVLLGNSVIFREHLTDIALDLFVRIGCDVNPVGLLVSVADNLTVVDDDLSVFDKIDSIAKCSLDLFSIVVGSLGVEWIHSDISLEANTKTTAAVGKTKSLGGSCTGHHGDLVERKFAVD